MNKLLRALFLFFFFQRRVTVIVRNIISSGTFLKKPMHITVRAAGWERRQSGPGGGRKGWEGEVTPLILCCPHRVER